MKTLALNIIGMMVLGISQQSNAVIFPTAYDTNTDAVAQAFVVGQIGNQVASSNYLTSIQIAGSNYLNAIQAGTQIGGSNYITQSQIALSNYVTSVQLAGSNYLTALTAGNQIAGSNYITS